MHHKEVETTADTQKAATKHFQLLKMRGIIIFSSVFIYICRVGIGIYIYTHSECC